MSDKLLADGNPTKSILYGANFGRDADTIATMVGALAGAFMGVDALKLEWVNKIKKSNPAQEELTLKIVEVIRAKVADNENAINIFKQLK